MKVYQWAMKFDQPVTFEIDPGRQGTGIMELAKMIYQSKESEAGNGDDYVKP